MDDITAVMKLPTDTKADPSSHSTRREVGRRIVSIDGHWIVQIRVDRISVSFVSKEPGEYPGWEKFREPVLALADKYFSAMGATSVSRVGLRYINQVDTPPITEAITGVSEEDGLPMVSTFHQIAGGAGGSVRATVARTEVDVEESIRVILQQVWGTKPGDDAGQLTLDIDALYMKQFTYTPAEFSRILEKLRDVKNRLFFDSFAPEVIKAFA